MKSTYVIARSVKTYETDAHTHGNMLHVVVPMVALIGVIRTLLWLFALYNQHLSSILGQDRSMSG